MRLVEVYMRCYIN